MNKAEVYELFIVIKDNYAAFDDSDDEVDRHYKYLKDFPFDAAMKNVDDHILVDRFPPKIADIRGKLGDQLDRERSKDQAALHQSNLVAWANENNPPPEGYWQALKDKLRGEVIE
ncbi:hypothetical protein BBD42_30980 [Paenibacillus sp. BIHB 4019]|uniref:Replicative helicase inhibitor G39P N-terminal domain-containing protein n=1 Tax=Paenibacillus sp. BIHB 4019 TaxID=1870819 RepID=A0A1B2DRU4_9BACL|nr:hypothetical protein [Paenibacillus sp. BIHB 4019]ANY70429.1 hypothetical protein BBD42_30980 [Paenibacillus sp. BIHB 4019]